jgi:hypothetical protein
MSLPKSSAASGLLYGIVVGGDQSDPDPDQANGLRVYFPTIHGKDVKVKDLAFSPRILSPDRAAMQSFSGGLDPGSMVVAYKDTGSTQCQILGLASDLNNYESNIPGNIGLLQIAPILAQFLNMSTGVSRPPTIQESSEGGAKIFKINERGDHNHNLLKGLPTHGALFPLNGRPIDPIKSITTAIQAALSIPDIGILNALPGIAMSLGGMLNNILSVKNLSKQLKGGMSSSAFNAVSSMSALIQTVEQNESSGFLTSGKVNPDVYMKNAIDLISQCTNLSDVTSAMTRLQGDTSLFGMEEYGPSIIEQDTPFGKVQTSFSASGEQITLTPAAVVQGLNSLSKLMTGAGFPGVIPGQSMFGSAGSDILSMMQRIPGGGFSQALSMAQSLNISPEATKLFSVANEVFSGGNPLTKLLGGE